MNNDTMTHRCVACGEDITLKTNGHGRCNNCEAHVKILDYGGDDNMDDANRMTNSIEKLSVLRMMAMNFEELLEHADEVSAYNEEVQRGLRRKAYAEGFEEGRNRESAKQYFDKAMEEVSKVVAETPQEKRDRIVERAKADIEELKDDVYDCYNVYKGAKNEIYGGLWYPFSKFSSCDAEFIINKDKRTVVVLMKGKVGGALYARGIAKCAPNDCFNIHIGKSIALHRALGLEVPDKYIHAPQPTDVRVGDVVKSGWSRKEYLATRGPMLSGNCITRENAARNNFEITDDSREDDNNA